MVLDNHQCRICYVTSFAYGAGVAQRHLAAPDVTRPPFYNCATGWIWGRQYFFLFFFLANGAGFF